MHVVDSHTGGEPTRVILDGGPDLGSGSLAERARRLGADHAAFCTSVTLEPRGREAMVGALLLEPDDPGCAAAIIYFNAAGPLGMCGHASIGVAVTLSHLGRMAPGSHRIQTPVGAVTVELHSPNEVSVTNVESFRHRQSVVVQVPGHGEVSGDVAWGGNWFFLVKASPLVVEAANIPALTQYCRALQAALAAAGITGRDGAAIDHIELFGHASLAGAHSRNFVLCPDGTYDRSPCGTGSSAKLACLAADGALGPGQAWIQESIVGSTYRLHYAPGVRGGVVVTIRGSAFVTAEATLRFDPQDPFLSGIKL